MTRIEISQAVDAPPARIWPHLADLGSHTRWMKDARSIVFVGEQTTGPGTVMEVETRVGPFRTVDRMEVTDWREGESISVRHIGVVTGEGTLSLVPRNGGTVVVWAEELRFPWWMGGRLGAWVARPLLAWIWRGNLRRLAALVTP